MFLLQVSLNNLSFKLNNFTIFKLYFTENIKPLCRTDSDMSSSGYLEYRSDSWIDDDHTNKSSSLKRDKRSDFDRYVLFIVVSFIQNKLLVDSMLKYIKLQWFYFNKLCYF